MYIKPHNNYKNLIFLGPPGSGKGTQVSRISNTIALKKIVAGDLVRDEIRSGSVIGANIESIVNSGGFVPDSLVMSILRKDLVNSPGPNHVILDGFPRTLYQAKALEILFNQMGSGLLAVLFFDISESDAVKRLMGRYSCSNCGMIYHKEFSQPLKTNICDSCGSSSFIHRTDDDREVIRRRFSLYKKETLPLLDFYRKRNILKFIDASSDMKLVTEHLINSLNINDN